MEPVCIVCGSAIPDDRYRSVRKVCSDQCLRARRTERSRTHRARHRNDPKWMAARAAQMKAWREANPEAWKAHARKRELKGAYKMTPEQYDDLLASQGGRCAICGRTDADGHGRRLHVDHDHDCCPGSRSCGKCIRGLLCKTCNHGIGHFHDDPATLYAAIRYLAGVRNPGGSLIDKEPPWQPHSSS